MSGADDLSVMTSLLVFFGVVMTVHSSGVSAASIVASGSARVSRCHVATTPMLGRHGRVSPY